MVFYLCRFYFLGYRLIRSRPRCLYVHLVNWIRIQYHSFIEFSKDTLCLSYSLKNLLYLQQTFPQKANVTVELSCNKEDFNTKILYHGSFRHYLIPFPFFFQLQIDTPIMFLYQISMIRDEHCTTECLLPPPPTSGDRSKNLFKV